MESLNDFERQMKGMIACGDMASAQSLADSFRSRMDAALAACPDDNERLALLARTRDSLAGLKREADVARSHLLARLGRLPRRSPYSRTMTDPAQANWQLVG